MEEPVPGAGSLTPKPPENPVIQITESVHVVDNVNNAAGETADKERNSRSSVRSSSVGGGVLLVLLMLTARSARRGGKEREKVRKHKKWMPFRPLYGTVELPTSLRMYTSSRCESTRVRSVKINKMWP